MEPNKRVGDYEILGELGSGGMGRVYRVRNVISDRVEAMKVLLPDLIGRQELAARFLREIKLLAALNHPHIAALRTALTVDNQLVMIMEYVEGQSLAARLEHGPIVLDDALTYVDQVLDALSYAHEQHVIHRDIKPANMMLTPQGIVKLMDFGIARSNHDQTLTVAGTTTGSLSYMAPEQVRGEPTDARSDLYSVGISLYEMVTGQRPFQANSDYAIMAAQLNEAPKPPIQLQPGLGSPVNEIILKAIAKDPAQRFQSAKAFRDSLNHVRPASARAATTSRKVTMVDAAVSAALVQDASALAPTELISKAPRQQVGSDHARTIVDTRTPSSPLPQVPRTNVASHPGVQPPPTKASRHPAVYMVLGGLVVIGALIGAGLYIRKAEADPKATVEKTIAPAPDPVKPSAPSDKPSAASEKPSAPSEKPSAPSVRPSAPSVEPVLAATTPKSPVAKPVIGKAAADKAPPIDQRGGTRTERPGEEPDPKPQETAQSPVDLDKLEHEIDLLAARAGAVNNSLDRLQQQQARQGVGLRGDMAARQQSLKLNLSKAQEAVAQRNAARAQRYRDLTEGDVEALEQFLGR